MQLRGRFLFEFGLHKLALAVAIVAFLLSTQPGVASSLEMALTGLGASWAGHVEVKWNREQVKRNYKDGELENLQGLLERVLKENAPLAEEDSAFIARYLGVIYAANENTAERGKYWFHRLLSIQPSATLVDLFVSEKVQHIFEKVKEERLALTQLKEGATPNTATVANPMGVEPLRNREPIPVPKPHRATSIESSHRLWWIGGGVALLIAGGVITYSILASNPSSSSPQVN